MSARNQGNVIHLNGQEDWDDWSDQLISLTRANWIWQKIDPDVEDPEPFLTPPPRIDIGDYDKRAAPPATAAHGARSASVVGVEEEQVDHQNKAKKPSELTLEAREMYIQDQDIYQNERWEFEQEAEKINWMMDWIFKTVDPHFRRIACKPLSNLREWYAGLKNLVGPRTREKHNSARNVYHKKVRRPKQGSRAAVRRHDRVARKQATDRHNLNNRGRAAGP